MRIICAFMSDDPILEEARIRESFPEHEVVIVRSYEDLRYATQPPEIFNVILMDALLKWSLNSNEIYPAGGFMLGFLNTTLVRGLGVFLPDNLDFVKQLDFDGYHSVVLTQSCQTDWGGRNWIKLLELVTARMDEIDKKVT